MRSFDWLAKNRTTSIVLDNCWNTKNELFYADFAANKSKDQDLISQGKSLG